MLTETTDGSIRLSGDEVEAIKTSRNGDTVGRVLGNHPGRCIGSQTTNTPIGRGSVYVTARLARERPAILERLKAGDFTSVRAAECSPAHAGTGPEN